MAIDEKCFETVELDTLGRTPCSPTAPEDLRWCGILIQAPRKVFFTPGVRVGLERAFAAMALCGYLRQRVTAMPVSGIEALHFVVQNQKTGKIYLGHMVSRDTKAEEPPDDDPLTEEQLSKILVGIYFNPNIAIYVSLPEKEARYTVYVDIGIPDTDNYLRSNQVEIDIVEKPAVK